MGARALGRSTHRNALPSRNRPPAIGTFAIHKATRRVPGKYLYTADALSRAPLRGTIDRGSEEFQREVNFYVNAVLVQLPASDRRLEEIRREVAKDDTLAIVSRYVKTGWPDDKRKVHGPVNLYWPERGNLSIHADTPERSIFGVVAGNISRHRENGQQLCHL